VKLARANGNAVPGRIQVPFDVPNVIGQRRLRLAVLVPGADRDFMIAARQFERDLPQRVGVLSLSTKSR